jgi:hypothetical protein
MIYESRIFLYLCSLTRIVLTAQGEVSDFMSGQLSKYWCRVPVLYRSVRYHSKIFFFF